jgi:hypothetical protein
MNHRSTPEPSPSHVCRVHSTRSRALARPDYSREFPLLRAERVACYEKNRESRSSGVGPGFLLLLLGSDDPCGDNNILREWKLW